jgi:plastocyanin domain-containing protein
LLRVVLEQLSEAKKAKEVQIAAATEVAIQPEESVNDVTETKSSKKTTSKSKSNAEASPKENEPVSTVKAPKAKKVMVIVYDVCRAYFMYDGCSVGEALI